MDYSTATIVLLAGMTVIGMAIILFEIGLQVRRNLKLQRRKNHPSMQHRKVRLP